MEKKKKIIEEIEKDEKIVKKVKLKSSAYNNDNELIDKRNDEETNDAVMWGFVIGFALFFVLLIIIICLIH